MNLPPKGSCSEKCPEGYYPVDSPTWKCLQCWQASFSPYSCATCKGGESNNCITCNPGAYLHEGQCIYPCPDGYYADSETKKCVQCHQSGKSPYSCQTCTGGGNDQCTSCMKTYYLYKGQCLSICDEGFWADLDSKCQPCWANTKGNPYGCKTCSGGGTSDCQSCDKTYYLHPLTGGECLDSCPVHFWSDTTSNTCQPCHSSTTGPEYTCYSCTGGKSNNCLSCDSGYFLYESMCLDTCPDGFWGDTVSNTCRPCWSSKDSPYSCVTCNAQSSDSCLKCDSPYFLYPNTIGQCLLACPDGFWANKETRTCDSCWISKLGSPYSCKTCLSGASSSQCTACSEGAFLYPNTGGECVSPCPDGFWGDSYSNTCQPCWDSNVQPYTCAKCTGPQSTNCESCKPDTFLHQGQCITSCPEGYWGDTSSWECKPCWSSTTSPVTCKTCNAGGSSNCLSCNVGAFQYPMDSGSCLDVCPDGFYADNSDWKCKACYSTGVIGKSACLTCFGPLATNCKTCSAPATFYSPVDNSCVTTCPDGYYADNSDYPENQCRKCYQYNPPLNLDGTCATCDGPSSNRCLSCNSSQFLDSTTNTCVNTCPAGWWGDLTSNTCKPCYQAPLTTDFVQSCSMCVGPSSTDCTGCPAGSFLYSVNGSCLLNCPSIGFWEDSSSHTCKACYQYTAASPTDNTCVSCSGSNPNNCLSCNSTTFLDQTTNTCTFNCPIGYYGDTATNICKPCYSSDKDLMKTCKTCSGPNENNCLSCSYPNFYYAINNTCLASCPDGWYSNSVLNSCIQCYQNVPPSTWGTCATCSGTTYNNCDSCLSSDYFYDLASHTCVTSCPAGRYANTLTKQCHSCYQANSKAATNQQSCSTCKGPLSTDCLSCQKGHYYYAQGSQCLLTCPTGFYPNSVTFTCDLCYVSTASSKSNNNNENQQALSCASCTGQNYDECTGCFPGSYLDNSTRTCVSICPNGTYGDNQTSICRPCYNAQNNGGSIDHSQFSCATCYGPLPTQCTSCASTLALLTTSGSCTDTCPCESGYYYNSSLGQCGVCSKRCNFCTGPSDSDCVFDSSATLECFIGGFTTENSPRTQAAASVAAGGSYATATIALTTNILSGGITMGASTVLSALELLGIYQYINVNYPSNMVIFFQLVFAGNPLDFPNLFTIIWDPSDQLLNVDSNVQGDNKFHFYSVSRIFLANSGGDVTLLICLTGIIPFFLSIYYLLKGRCNAEHKIQRLMTGLKNFLMWNFILSTFMGSFVSTLLSICLQYRYANSPQVADSFEKFSIFVCVVVAIGYVAFMLLAGYVTFSKEFSTKKPVVYESVKVLANEEESAPHHQNENLKNKYFAFALCTRNFLLVPAIALFSDAPIAQCSLAIVINLAFFVTVSVWKFFASKTKRVIMRICEGFNTIIPILFLVFGINDLRDPSNPLLSDQAKQTIGWIVIVLISLTMVLSLLYTVNETWFILWQFAPLLFKYIKKACKRKPRTANTALPSTIPSANVSMNASSASLKPIKIQDAEVADLGKVEHTFLPDAKGSQDEEESLNNKQKSAISDLTSINVDNSGFGSSSLLQFDPQLSTDRKLLSQPETPNKAEKDNLPSSDSTSYSNKKQKTIVKA